jgi:soluble lytic murein transglycosylase
MRRLARAIALTLALWTTGPGGTPPLAAQGSADAQAFRSATGLAAAGDWDEAMAAVQGASPVTRDLLTWMRLREGRDAGASFGACQALVAARPHWPGMDRLRSRCEEVMPPDIAPGAVMAWFAAETPRTGEGAVHLARAMAAQGQSAQAGEMLSRVWLEVGMTAEGHAAMIAAFPDLLAPLHQDRTEAMLWRERTGDAERMLPLLPPDRRLLAEARIAMIRGADDRHTRVAAVPAALRGDAGLAYDRYTRLAAAGDFSDAAELLMARTDSAEALVQPFRWAAWRGQLARWAMREGRPRDAYAIAARHHLTTETAGEFLADLEWVAGYVALRYLNDPGLALRHFATMEGVVAGPISVSRASYWRGRAEEALGDPAARDSYARAARHQTAYYGLLAAERLGLPLDPALAGGESFGDWRQGAFLQTDLAAAMLLAVTAGRQNEAILFALKQAQGLDRTGIGQLGQMLIEMGEPFYALTVAKEAANRDIVIPSIYFPIHPMAQQSMPVEPALALAIARRESEFNTGAGSPVGALGLMQLMPATAEEVAGDLGLPWDRARLTADWPYNVTLGTAYLAYLQGQFGLAPVLVAAGYNAGASRPRTWMTQRGDPREDSVDVVDWVEHIPFAETRTYVMRVTESIPVYRARLSGQTGAIGITAILRGAPSVPRPPLRPDRSGASAAAATATPDPVAQAVADAVTQAAAAPAPGTSPLAIDRAIRPPARP